MNTHQFTYEEKAKCLEIMKTIPEDKHEEFINAVERHLRAVVSKHTLFGMLKGAFTGIVWDWLPGTELLTGIRDEHVTQFAILIGGLIGYRAEYNKCIFEDIKKEIMKNE